MTAITRAELRRVEGYVVLPRDAMPAILATHAELIFRWADGDSASGLILLDAIRELALWSPEDTSKMANVEPLHTRARAAADRLDGCLYYVGGGRIKQSIVRGSRGLDKRGESIPSYGWAETIETKRIREKVRGRKWSGEPRPVYDETIANYQGDTTMTTETSTTETSTTATTAKKKKSPRKLAPRRAAEAAARKAGTKKPRAKKPAKESTRTKSAIYSVPEIDSFVEKYAKRYAEDGKPLSLSDARHAIMTVAVNRLAALWRYQDKA